MQLSPCKAMYSVYWLNRRDTILPTRTKITTPSTHQKKWPHIRALDILKSFWWTWNSGLLSLGPFSLSSPELLGQGLSLATHQVILVFLKNQFIVYSVIEKLICSYFICPPKCRNSLFKICISKSSWSSVLKKRV